MASKSTYFKNADRSIAFYEFKKFKRYKRQKISIEYETTEPQFSKDDAIETGGKSLPPNWEKLFENIKIMRKDRNAVVDSQGCERTADEWEKPEVKRYQTLISLMLSSQTRDNVTFAAMQKLKEFGLNVPSMIEASNAIIEELIYPVGFRKRKASYIKKASQICHDKYNDDIPSTIQDLVGLPGVGPKMAHICMSAAWGKVTGIGVDTHVHRISNRLNWVKTKQPEQTRKELESWLPRCHWQEINILLVGFGQQTCLPIRPKCNTCLNFDICPSSNSERKRKGKRT